MSLFDEKYSNYKRSFESYLQSFVDSLKGKTLSNNLISSISYSLLADGKRIRPILFLATLDSLNIDYTKYLSFALSIELIHNYSLIHDDLPCMDNDDFRRGKPTNHKLYGEAMALLCGDALLNLSYELLLKECVTDGSLVKPAAYLSEVAGFCGMIGGQAVDIESENYTKTLETMSYINENKTSKLITAPVVCAAMLANATNIAAYEKFADNLGHLFQLTDDLLDNDGIVKTIGRDKTVEQVEFRYENCTESLKQIVNNEFFIDLTNKIKNRYK